MSALINHRVDSPSTSIHQPLVAIGNALGAAVDLEDLLSLILDLTMGELRAQQASILLYEKQTDTMKMLASMGLPEEVMQKGYVKRKGSVAEYVMENNEPLLLNDIISGDNRFTSVAGERPIKSSMCVPLRAQGRVIGTLNVTRNQGTENFTDDDLSTCVILASQAAISIERARLYEEKLKTERLVAVGQTVAKISHCIKNMLTPLKGGEAICRMGVENENWDMVSKGSSILKRNVDRISLLVLGMLDFSKERQPVCQAFEIQKMVDEVFESISFNDPDGKVCLAYVNPDGADTLFGDRDQIFRSLLNLVGNAFDAMGGEGRIEVRVDCFDNGDEKHAELCLPDVERTLCLRVIDDGKGIEADKLEDIFQPFFSTKGTKGTGLGLPVTKKIVEEHGGQLHVSSEIDKGTTFSLLFPNNGPDA